MKHAYLDSIGTYVIQNGANLPCNEVHRYRMDACDTYRIFIHHRHYCGSSIASACGKCLEIGLKPCSAARVAACNGQRHIVFLHIFHFSISYALFQNSHSSFTPMTKASVILSRS